MAVDPDTIFKVLRPVPEFDGNPHILTRFIGLCDQICATYLRPEPGYELTNLCLINGILNKITGSAARTINSNGIPENWTGIRNALVNNFADQRDETALYNDLSLATQGSRTPQEFYDHCQNLFSTIMTYVSLHEPLPTTIDAKRDLYKKLAKQAFVRGLKEPLGSRIRCMRPDSIEKALEYVQEELNVMYLQHRNDLPKMHTPRSIFASHMAMPAQGSFLPHAPVQPVQQPVFISPMSRNQQPMAVPSTPRGQQPWRPPVNQFPQGPTRTQQAFRALPPNYNPQSNLFKLPPRIQPQILGTRPMSGVSHYVTKPLPPTGLSGHDWSKSGNPNPSNYFKSREMNFNECVGYDGYYYPEYSPETDTYNYQIGDTNYVDMTQTYDCDETQYYPDCNVTDVPNGNDYDEQPLRDHPQPSTSNSEQDFQKGPYSRKSK